MNTTVQLSQQLIQKPSVTPDDHGCLDLLAERLAGSGFSCQMLAFENVSNAWIVRGEQAPLFVFAGHTDVVPTGPTEHWTYPPFAGHIENGQLHGRGSADMKTAIAAMTVACEEFIQEHPKHNGSIGFLLTSDEEGPAKNGTIKVIEHLQANNIHIDYCLVGEPSSSKTMGDVIKNGRRGSLGAHLTVQGKQGHVAYPHLAINPIHHLSEILTTLSALEWDQGNEYFPATTFQVSNVRAGTGADNVIPGSAEAWFNIRFSTEITAEQIQARVASVLENYRVEIDWRLSGQPFITPEGRLVNACKTAIKQVTGIDTQLSTGGGTSDGRFIAPTGAEVVELGVTNASIHQIDEHTNIEQLMQLKETYKQVLTSLLLDQ